MDRYGRQKRMDGYGNQDDKQTRGSYRRLLDNVFDVNDAISIIEDMTEDERANCCSDYWMTVQSCNGHSGTSNCGNYGGCTSMGDSCCQCYGTGDNCETNEFYSSHMDPSQQFLPGGQVFCSCYWQSSFSCNLAGLCCSGGGGSGGGAGGPGGVKYGNFGGYSSRSGAIGRYRRGGRVRRKK